MKLSKELVLQAVTAAFEFNAKNDHADAFVSYSKDNFTLGLSVSGENDWVYYKVSNQLATDNQIYAQSHKENLAGFLNALKSHTSHV